MTEISLLFALIKVLYEQNENTNAFTDADKTKLEGLTPDKSLGEYPNLAALQAAHPSPQPGSFALVDAGVGEDVVTYLWDTSDAKYVPQVGATTAETPASIRTKLLQNADTNILTNAQLAKLNAIEAGATGDQTGAEIIALLNTALGGAAWQLGVATAPPETAANIADVDAAINTTGKVNGRLVRDVTNRRLMVAEGPAAADPWATADGAVTVTPSAAAAAVVSQDTNDTPTSEAAFGDFVGNYSMGGAQSNAF